MSGVCFWSAVALMGANLWEKGMFLQKASGPWFLGIDLLLALVVSLVLARRKDSTIFYLTFQALALTLYFFLRRQTALLSFLQGYDPHAILVFALTFFQVSQVLDRDDSHRAAAFRFGGYFLPLLVLAYQPWKMQTMGSALYLLASVHFGMIYLHTEKRLAGMLALALLNFALFQIWAVRDIVNPQFYAIPVGLTLLAVAEGRLGLTPNTLYTLRLLGILTIYGSCGVQILLELDNPMHSLFLGFLALLGIGLGLWLRQNLYLYLAGSFLVADVLGYMLKYGFDHGILGGVLLLLTGLSVLGLTLYFKIRGAK